jgi:hypothetical protein
MEESFLADSQVFFEGIEGDFVALDRLLDRPSA